jgi:hypothetical protein
MSQGLKANRSRSSVIELHFENREGRVCIVPPDNNIMAIPVETAIAACQAFKTQIQFKDQFDQLIATLGEWIAQRNDRIADAYLTVRDSGLLFLLVTKSKQYDDELETALTELDLEIAHDSDFDLISLGVHAIPLGPVESFVSRKMALRFVPDGDRG